MNSVVAHNAGQDACDVIRFWDLRAKCHVVKLLPGQCYVTQQQELITTVLGSCVAVCMRDPVIGLCGMNHFMLPVRLKFLPDSETNCVETPTTRFGEFAMQHLIDSLIALGAVRERLQIKVFGGANLLSSVTDVGQSNIQFLWSYLRHEGLEVQAEDLGGTHARRVEFSVQTGVVRVKKLSAIRQSSLINEEKEYESHLKD